MEARKDDLVLDVASRFFRFDEFLLQFCLLCESYC